MVAASDMILAAQQRCDRVNASTILAAEWLSMVNASVQELYGTLTSTYQDYNVKRFTFALAGGDPPLNTLLVGPSTQVPDFFQPRGLWWQLSPSPGVRWMRLARLANLLERSRFTTPLISLQYGQMPSAWDLRGNEIEILPPQASGGSYMLNYVPTMPRLLSPDATIDAQWLTINGWDEYVVLDVAAKALIKEESLETANLLLQQKEQLRQRILREAAPRDDSEPGQIADMLGSGPIGMGAWGAFGPFGW